MDPRELLARTLMAEAGGEGLQGMLAAGSVINNRVKNGGYGDGLSGVIMKPGQFSAWNGVTGYASGQGGLDMQNMRPSATAYQAADTLLSGQYEDPTGGATHYYNPAVANPKWGQRNGDDWQKIGNHVFGFADAGRKSKPNQAIADQTMAAIGKAPQPEPKGSGGILSLLGSAGNDNLQGEPMQQQQPRGILGRMFPNMDEETRESIRYGLANLGSLSVTGANTRVMDSIDKRRDTRASDAKDAKQRIVTAEWLMQQPGGAQYGQAIAIGALPASAGLQMWQAQNKGPDQTAVQQQYAQAVQQGYKGTLMDYQMELKRSGASNSTVNVNNSDGTPADADLRKELNKDEGALWGTYLKMGNASSSLGQDFQVLDELIQLAPQGPISGRLAETFPGVNSAGDAFNSIVKRIAPTMRAEGSGSTSDIEYTGMLRSLPSLINKPEANALISQVMKSKAQINMQRGQVIQQYQNGELTAVEARKMVSEIDGQSIMSPEMKRLLMGVAPNEGGPSAGDVVEGYTFNGGDPGDQNNWTKVQ